MEIIIHKQNMKLKTDKIMNEIFNDGHLIIHDDREFITPEQAFKILWDGGKISVCDPPDYGAESDYEVHSAPFQIDITDIISGLRLSKDEAEKEVFEYLRSYEISK